MKKRMFIIAVVLSAVFYCQAGWSIENPGIGNPVGPSTVPPSTLNSSLMNTPSPIDTSGNLLVTGNVRRGRHFRGDVPYRSPTSFGSSLGSSSLSSFLRDSAGSQDYQTYSNKYGNQPYYSPAETVTHMMPGRSEIFMPESTMASARTQQKTRSEVAGAFGSESMPRQRTLFSQAAATAGSDLQEPITRYGLLAQSRLMLESEFPNQQTDNQSLNSAFEMQKSGQNRDVDDKQSALYQGISALEQFSPSTGAVSQKDLFLQQSTNLSAASRKLQAAKEQTSAGTFEPAYRTKNAVSGLAASEQDLQQSDVLERIRQQLEDLARSLDAAIQKRDAYKDLSTEPALKQERTPLGYQQQYRPPGESQDSRETINSSGSSSYYSARGTELGFNAEETASVVDGGLHRTGVGMQSGLEFSGIPDYENSYKNSSPLDELKKLSHAEISSESDRIMGSYNSLESLSASKFNQHMREAQEHLNAGRYYRAAGSFSLALVYREDNPDALAGRGHALFATGEYVSSALFLSRALAISPEYLRKRIDLVAMLGDENKLAGRIADIEQWLARSGSSQLQFLLGYVYYRTGQFLRAKQAIDAAYEKAPDSPAIQVMKITIDSIMIR